MARIDLFRKDVDRFGGVRRYPCPICKKPFLKLSLVGHLFADHNLDRDMAIELAKSK